MNEKTISGLIGLLGAGIAYLISRNVWITVCAFVLALMLGMALRPNFKRFLEKRKKKSVINVTISTLRQRGFDENPPEERVLYVLLITQNTELDPDIPAHRAILEDIYDRTVSRLSEAHEFFRNRYAKLSERELPYKISTGTCTDKRSSVGRCHNAWQQAMKIDKNFYGKENVDTFFDDLQFTDADGETQRNAVVAATFYKW